MILTVCPNPSVDCTIELDSLNVGMLNRIDNKVETYSGKALNVAIGVARLGEPVASTGFMFENHRKMFVQNEGSARTNYKIIDKKSMLTEINDRGEEVDREKQLALIEKVRALSEESEITVMSGSLPKGVEPSFYGEVLKAIPSRVKVIVDTEKANMLAAINAREIFMAKPNVKELEKFSGMTVSTKYDMAVAAKKYLDSGVKYVLVSMGADGAVLTDGHENYYCKSASVAVNSTVGAGDSMIAAACVAESLGVSPQELLRRAVAAGTAAVTTSGTNLFYKEKYKEIYAKVFAEKF